MHLRRESARWRSTRSTPREDNHEDLEEYEEHEKNDRHFVSFDLFVIFVVRSKPDSYCALPIDSPETTISTRRFCWRPADVPLVATGRLSP